MLTKLENRVEELRESFKKKKYNKVLSRPKYSNQNEKYIGKNKTTDC